MTDGVGGLGVLNVTKACGMKTLYFLDMDSHIGLVGTLLAEAGKCIQSVGRAASERHACQDRMPATPKTGGTRRGYGLGPKPPSAAVRPSSGSPGLPGVTVPSCPFRWAQAVDRGTLCRSIEPRQS